MPGKFNLAGLMNEHSKREGDAFAFKIELLDIEQIQPSELNRYSVNDVAELKASIELIGLQQNLLVREREAGGAFELVSGHRRFKALRELVSEGKDDFRRVPCKIIKSIDDIEAELQLIFANSTSRRLTDFELTYQAQRLKELLTGLKQSGFKFTGKKRDIVADLLKVSPSQVARYESINNHLSPELTEEFRKEEINVTTAFELSRLNETQQAEALEEHKSGVTLTPDSVKEKREAAKKPPRKTPDSTAPEAEAAKPYIDASPQEQQRRNERDAEKYVALHEQNEPELLPCPFCGSAAAWNDTKTPDSATIICTGAYEESGAKCIVLMHGETNGKSRADVLQMWNKRK